MRAEHNPDLVSRLDLERWALGALDPERAAALEVRRQSDAELSARMERVRAEISAAGCDLPPLELPVDEQEEVYAPVRVAPWWRSLLRPGGLALAAATTIAVVVVVALPPDPLGTPEPTPGGQEIFRGALDCRATAINEDMKRAATRAIAGLARRGYDAGDHCWLFGRELIVPKPFDHRLLEHVAAAVAQAAMDSGVARVELDLDAYRTKLRG